MNKPTTELHSNHDIQYSTNNYVEYHPGQSNIIISVPHGGGLKPNSIPNRDAGAFIDGHCVYRHVQKQLKDPQKYPVKYKKDLHTIELGKKIVEELYNISGKRPHLIINNLYRGKMDPNCDRQNGTFCVPMATDAWMAYHSFIERAQLSVNSLGLLLDIHGQVHAENWVELGYTLTSNLLNNAEYTPEMTSVYSLYRNSKAEVNDISDIISGQLSLGALLSGKGYKVVPSPVYPNPGNGLYYTGGFITEMHGSKNGGCFDAIQIELPAFIRAKENIAEFAKDFAKVVNNFVSMHYS